MKFHPWSGLPGMSGLSRRLGSLRHLRSHRSTHQPTDGAGSPGADRTGADLDHWVRLATGDDDDVVPVFSAADQGPPVDLLREVQRVLADENASLVPPVAAAGVSQAEWDAMPSTERRWYQRRQLEFIDPRLLARTMSRNTSINRWLRR